MLLSFSKCLVTPPFSKELGLGRRKGDGEHRREGARSRAKGLRQAKMIQGTKQQHDKGGPHTGDEETMQHQETAIQCCGACKSSRCVCKRVPGKHGLVSRGSFREMQPCQQGGLSDFSWENKKHFILGRLKLC